MVIEHQESLDGLIKTFVSPIYDLPRELPLSHLSRQERLAEIVHEGVLKPQMHSVLGAEDNVIFLMYGGIFYRSTTDPVRDRTQAPIAFVFHPRILANAYKYFPFDTGMIEKKIGKSWAKTLEPIKVKYEILGLGDQLIPRKLVQRIFGSNRNYVRGKPNPNLNVENALLNDLYKFYLADLTKPDINDGRLEGIDRRQCVIECQFNTEVSLLNDLIWIGIPDEDYDLFSQLYQKHNDPINLRCYPYDFYDMFRPNELEMVLEKEAHEAIIRLILKQEENRNNGT